jgi:hypothetical protein
MDVMTDPTFWGEVGLAAAARLAVLAAVIWVARMVLGKTTHTFSPALPRANYASATTPRSRLEDALSPAPPSFVNLQPRAGSAGGTAPRSVTRDRLMQYLQQRSMERTMP